jgi:hypothetical protein
VRRTFTNFFIVAVVWPCWLAAQLSGGVQPLTSVTPGAAALDLEIEPGSANQATSAVVTSGWMCSWRRCGSVVCPGGPVPKAGSYEVVRGVPLDSEHAGARATRRYTL